jgi:hypothetical protein
MTKTIKKHAKENYFWQDDGVMFPSHASLYAAPVQLDAYMADRVGFWTDVYGFDMTPMAQKVVEDKLAGKGRALLTFSPRSI